MTSISASKGVSVSLSLSQNILQRFRMHCSPADASQRWRTGGCRETPSSPLRHRDGSDAVELPLPLKARWYDPAMCQGYLNERGMTVASPDSWQEPGRGGRGEWMLRLHQLCLLYVCGTDWIMRQCVRVSEWMNEWQSCFAEDVCWFIKCSFVFATCSFCLPFILFSFLTCFGRFPAMACTYSEMFISFSVFSFPASLHL